MNLTEEIKALDLGHSPNKSTMIEIFKLMRKTKLRRPDIVLKHYKGIIASVPEAEKWNILEQAANAALDFGNDSEASSIIKTLSKRFPSSKSVFRLEGLQMESQGRYNDALKKYDEILKEDPFEITSLKRKVSCYLGMGNVLKAIEELQNITGNFPGDSAAWLMLSKLYLDNGNIESAAYCLEEVIIIDPQVSHYHTALADLYYSLGDISHVTLARKHYSISLTILDASMNLRAVYGLLYTSRRIVDLRTKNSDPEDDKVNAELLRWAEEKLQ